MMKHGTPGDTDDEAIAAVLASEDARDYHLSPQDVANIKARDIDRATWKRSARDVESVWLAVRTPFYALMLAENRESVLCKLSMVAH